MEKVIIVGAGPAGISAALYAARANMNPLVISNGIGALEKAEKSCRRECFPAAAFRFMYTEHDTYSIGT